jgi:hypothetical protein
MKELKILREMFHNQFLHIRNCNNLIQSDDFEIACKLAKDGELDEIMLAIAELNKDRIRSFIEDKLGVGTPFEQLSIRKLRAIGQNLKIPSYERLNKLTLIEEIKNVAERLKKNCERKCI